MPADADEEDMPEGIPGVDEHGHPPRDENGQVVYPFRYEWTKPCPEHGMVKVRTVVFQFGKMAHRGECGHTWDRSGELAGKWLDETARQRWSDRRH